MLKTAIQAVALNKWFGEGEAQTHAVKDVSFSANFGEMLYVVGPSGSGDWWTARCTAAATNPSR